MQGRGSPYSQRFSKISEKLSAIPLNQEGSRANRIDNIESRVLNLQDRFVDAVNNYNKKIHNLTEQFQKIHKMVDQESRAFDFHIDARGKELEALDQKLRNKIEFQINTRKERQNEINRYLQEKTSFLRADIGGESQFRAEVIENINQSLESDLPKLYQHIKSEGAEREANDQITVQKAAEEIQQLNDSVAIQKQLREESQANVFEMLKDLVNRVQSEIDEEKSQREQSHETILGLLEEACNQLCTTAQI